MLNSPVLDLIILLSFTYFIGSLILSAINEAIAGWLRLRQKQLKQSLETMFFDDDWKPFVRNKLIKTPHIQSLFKSKDRYPAYISASNFVLAIIDQIGADQYTPASFISGVKSSKMPISLQKVLVDLFAQAQQDLAKFEKNLEGFYDNMMDRTTGRYKTKIRRTLLITGLILSVVLNLDTIKIANDALKDQDKLSNTVDRISASLSQINMAGDSVLIKDSAGLVVYKVTGGYHPQTAADDTVSLKELLARSQKLKVVYEQTTGYRLGYNGDFKDQWSRSFWKKLLGVLITAFALQMGSNYWFDLMNKAVNIRAAGKKPGTDTDKKTT